MVMDNTTENLITKILDITDYQGDKQAFVDEFVGNIQLEALLHVISDNPDKKDSWMRSLNNMQSPEEIKQFIGDNIPTEDYAKQIEEVSEKSMKAYLRSIEGSLTENQKYDIAKLNI